MIQLIWIPILGAFILATGTVVQRSVLKKRKININLFQSAQFAAIVIACLPFLYFFWKLEPGFLTLANIGIFFLIIIFSLIAIRFSLYSMKWEKITHIEPAKILEPLFTIILAILFSFIIDSTLYERNLNVIIPALISGLALVLSHIKKHHFEFNKYFIAAILGSFFFALDLVTSRLILDYFSPLTFYFLRCATILILSLIIFKPNFEMLAPKVRWEILGVGFLWVIYRVMVYYGYLELGVVFTTLMVMLGPILVYFFAWKFLKEKLDRKSIVAAGVIVACVVYAILA